MKSSKSVYNYAAFIAALTCFGQAGCALETMKKASSEVSRNPELCKRALAEGYPKPEYEVEGVSYTQDWIYKKTIYEKCLEVEIMKKPQICSSVLAAGMPPPARGLSPKQHELRRMHEYFACKTFAGDILDNLDNLGSSSIVNDSSDEQYSNADYGKVASVQIENLSRPGNRAGSTAGAAVGQIAYLENSQLTNYNPWSQIGAGVLGAAIGSSLDESPQILYKITYWIRRNDGEFFPVEILNKSPTHLPEGICVAVTDNNRLLQASQKRCK